jgi:hypothetical protein
MGTLIATGSLSVQAEIANPVKQQLEVLRSTLDSIDSPRGQVPGHEVPTLSTVANKADMTAFAYYKHRLVESKGLEEPMRRVTLIAQAKTDMRKDNASVRQIVLVCSYLSRATTLEE